MIHRVLPTSYRIDYTIQYIPNPIDIRGYLYAIRLRHAQHPFALSEELNQPLLAQDVVTVRLS